MNFNFDQLTQTTGEWLRGTGPMSDVVISSRVRLARNLAERSFLITAVDRACRHMGIIYTDEHELNRLIGQRIRSHRLSQNLTLRQLSDRTDLTTSQLSQVELGKNAASIWALARISNSLGLQVSQLLEGL